MGLMSLVGIDKIFNFLGSICSGILHLFTKMSALLIAIKAISFTSITVVLLSALYNLYVTIMGAFWNWVYSYLESQQTEISSMAYEFTGLGAWLFQHLKIAECLAVIFVAISIRFIIKLIPFIG